jgi:hypothetical protein
MRQVAGDRVQIVVREAQRQVAVVGPTEAEAREEVVAAQCAVRGEPGRPLSPALSPATGERERVERRAELQRHTFGESRRTVPVEQRVAHIAASLLEAVRHDRRDVIGQRLKPIAKGSGPDVGQHPAAEQPTQQIAGRGARLQPLEPALPRR